MNTLSKMPPTLTSSPQKNTVIHDKDIYHEMMKEMGISTSSTSEDMDQLYFSQSNHSKRNSQHRRTFHEENEYEDYDEEDSDFGVEHDDDDVVFSNFDSVLSKNLMFRKEKDDATEVTTAETDLSLNGSSWHSCTSQRSGYSTTSSNFSSSPRRRHGNGSSRRFRYHNQDLKEQIETVAIDPPSVHVFEDPDSSPESSDSSVVAVNVDCLQSRGMLGEGFFGQVFLVDMQAEATDHPSDSTRFALKRLSKYHLLCEDQIHTVVREKEILQSCRHHPSIVTLYQTFQDDSYLYLLQSYIPGGELFTLLHNTHFTMSETHSQFYTACIADALWYLHCSAHRPPIVYRDLKPENVMLNALGYPILIDFGYAKCLSPPDDDHRAGDLYRTYTLCGTSKYLSPEMIDGQGHGTPTDYWSLGIVVYELLSQGEHPFEFYPQMDDRSLFRAIADADYLPLPEHGISDAGLDLVDQLLAKDPSHRLGTEETTASNPVLQHPWLRTWNVAELRLQSYSAPWVPSDSVAPANRPVHPSWDEEDGDTSGRSSQSDTIPLFHKGVKSHLTRREQALFAGF